MGGRHDLSTSAFHYRKGPATKPPTPTVARHRADLVPLRAASKTKASGPMVASHDSWRDPWVAVGELAVGDARAQYTAGLDPPQTASITSRAKVPRPLVSLHLRVQPARPGPPHTTSRPVAPPCAASTGSPPYTNRLGPRRADAARVPRHRRQRSNARAETIVAAPTTRGGELRYVRRGSAADDWLEHRALLPGSVCTRARVPHGAFFGCAPRIHVRGVTFRGSGPPAAAPPGPGSAWYDIRQK